MSFYPRKVTKRYLYTEKGERKSIKKFEERENAQMTFELQKHRSLCQ